VEYLMTRLERKSKAQPAAKTAAERPINRAMNGFVMIFFYRFNV